MFFKHEVSEADAKDIVSKIAKYDDLFADVLLRQLSGIEPPSSEVGAIGVMYFFVALADLWLSLACSSSSVKSP